MTHPSSLTDKEWKLIKQLLPIRNKPDHLVRQNDKSLDGIFYQLKNGCNWCDLPKDLPPYSSVFWHFALPRLSPR